MQQINCNMMKVHQKPKEGMLGKCANHLFSIEHEGIIYRISIEQYIYRIITITTPSLVNYEKILRIYDHLENLLMLFDGRFYDIKELTFSINGSQQELMSLTDKFFSDRLAVYNSADFCCYTWLKILDYTIITPDLFCKWIQLRGELGIAHQVILYSLSDVKISVDIKCAMLIEAFETISELIALRNPTITCFQMSNLGTLKKCLDAAISHYGQDIFEKECQANKNKFLKILKETRIRIMHIKRNQPDNEYLTGKECVLYVAKLTLLYRNILLNLLDVNNSIYMPKVTNAVNYWNSWQNCIDDFLVKLR